MSELRIGQNLSKKLTPVIVNEYDDVIYIDVNDTTFVNRVIDLFQWVRLVQMKLDNLQKEYEKETKGMATPENVEDESADEFLAVYRKYTEEVVKVHKEICIKFDDVFGKGTIKKYFRKFYEAFGEDWIPTEECIEDFMDEIIPVVKQLFEDRKASLRRRYTKRKKK